jgi:tRNA(adenine34) deaminase
MYCPDELLNTLVPQNEAQFLMAAALMEAAQAAKSGEIPAGALVVDSDGQILSQAHNRVISSCDPTAHAEILAIRGAAQKIGNYRLNGLILVSTLEPCPMCLMAAIHARLAKIYFGAPEPKWGAAGSLLDLQNLSGLNHRLEIEGNILAGPCSSLIQEFFRHRRSNIN